MVIMLLKLHYNHMYDFAYTISDIYDCRAKPSLNNLDSKLRNSHKETKTIPL